MTTSQDLLALTKAALLGAGAGGDPAAYATMVEDRVFAPGDWPSQQTQYPLLKLRLVSEAKTSLGRSGFGFLVVATIRVVAEVSAPAQIGDAGATAAETALWTLVRQIECAVINSCPLTGLLQQFPSIRTQLSFNADGATHLAGAQTDIDMEFVQTAEDFAPTPTVPLEGMNATNPSAPAAGLTINLQQ